MRDYDKEPIVIKDMNLLFSVLFQIPLILACCLVAIFKPGTNILFCSVIMFAPHLVPYFKYKNKRFIKITNEKIYFFQDDYELESIDLSCDFEIYKTFEPIYHKSQRPPKWASVILFVILPITYAVAISFSLTKYFYYLFCGKVKEYRFFDSYLIKQGEKIINISMIDKNIQKEVDVFLKEKRQIEPKNLKIFIDKVGYIYEKINFK